MLRPVRSIALAASVLAVVLVLSACARAGAPAGGPASGSQPSSEAVASGEATPTVESLKDLNLADRQEGLVFDYLVAGGLKALESRFGPATASYTTAADEASTASAELADGRAYQVQTGLDGSGRAVVMAHGVEAKAGQTMTAGDKAFLAAMKDGVTTLDEANAYLKRLRGATFRKGSMGPSGQNVPAYVWETPSGEGFIVIDLSGLDSVQLEALGAEPAVPFQVLYWDATRWRAY